MTEFRDHSPIVITEFNGLWKRGDADSCPPDHFTDCNNIAYIQGGFRWRDGIEPFIPISDIVRLYTYNKQEGQSIIALDTDGNFWDSDYAGTPILTAVETLDVATDFGFVSYAGRAYISPSNGVTGIDNAIFVYKGDGNPARPAGGNYPLDAHGALAAANSGSPGNIESGIHIFACVYETDTGFLTRIGPHTLPALTAPGSEEVDLTNIPVSPETYVVKRHLLATKSIDPLTYTGDTRGYQFFFIPDGTLNDNTATTLTVSFFDSELLEDASYLLDMYALIPAGAGLSTYHNRLVSWAEFDNESIIRISVAGEPEAFSVVDGLVIFPLDGSPVTNVQEFRDIMYATKRTKTNAWSDNGDVPSSWQMSVIDNGIGAGLHSIARVLDSEGVNIDFLIIGSFSGIYLFNGVYQIPELSFKIRDFWLALDRDEFQKIQVMYNSIDAMLEMTLPDGTMLHADCSNGLDPVKIRFTPWTFDINISSITLFEGNTLVLASAGMM